MSKKYFHIWEGIFERFPEEDNNKVWDSDRWVNTLGEQSLSNLNEFNKRGTISTHTLIHDYPLPIVVALLAAELTKPVRVLDFGGGLGSSFYPLITSLPSTDLVEFHIVESSAICRRGRDVFQKFPNIYFYKILPKHIKKFDLVHTASSLHYVSDWYTMIKKLTSYEPRYIMLSGLNAGDIKTFVTYQNYYDSKIPVWFWNIHEIIDALKDFGYKLIYKSLFASSYIGKIQEAPMENFPKEYRLRRKCNLIFVPNNCNQK